MPEIAESAKFVGRYNEITELAQYLESAASGKGQIVLINGEAGIGKTRLITQVCSLPIGQRFNWLSAKCISQEGADPYLPFTDAIKDWVGTELTTIVEPDLKDDGYETIKKEIFELEDLANIPVIGQKLTEDPSLSFGSFLIKEPKSEFSIKILRTLINQGKCGLCITRIPPDQLCSIEEQAKVSKFWLSSKPGKECLPPSLTKISHEITTFLRKNENNVILLDGLEYVMGHVDFNNVLRFINELVDTMAVHKAILLIPINPLTVDPKQLALLERNMNTLDINTLTKPPAKEPEDLNKLEEKYQLTEAELKNGRDRMFESTTQKILKIAKVKPVALFIDDLHWADVGALHLLHYLARAVENRSVAIIGAYRPEDISNVLMEHPLQELLDRLGREKLARTITLERLDRYETNEIIRSLLNNAIYPDELTNFIHKETEGNPFFIEEVLRSLNENGAIKYIKTDDRWILTKLIQEIKIPETVKEVVHSRINKLSKNMRLVLEVASVLGVEFEYDILAKVANIPEDELVLIIDDLVKFKLLIEEPTSFGEPIKYRFAHNKICEVLYKGLSESRRRLLHSKTAGAIEEKYQADPQSVVYELAQHCYHGASFEKALDYSKRAGDAALNNYAPEKARILYQWALNSIEILNKKLQDTKIKPDDNEHEEIITKLIEIDIVIGEYDDAISLANLLLNLSEDIKDYQKQVDVQIYLGQIHHNRSEWPKAMEHFKKALEIASKENYMHGLIGAYIGIGDVHRKMGEYDNAIQYYEDFMNIAKELKSPLDIAHGYKSMADIIHYQGDYKTSIEYYKKCVDELLVIENNTELARTYINMGVTYFELDEFDKVLECNEKGLIFAKKAGNIRMMGYGYSNAAEVYALKNETDKAIEYVNRALDIFTKLDEKYMIGLSWMNYGIIYKKRKEWDPAKYNFEKSISLLRELNIPYYLADSLRQYGLMLAEEGTNVSLSESKNYLEESLKLYNDLKIDKYVKLIENELKELPL